MGPKSAKSAKYRVFCGYTWKTRDVAGFLDFASDFAPDQLSDSGVRVNRETREFPEWSTKHPLFSLEISGNAKCWGPSVFLFVFRKTSPSPRSKGTATALGPTRLAPHLAGRCSGPARLLRSTRGPTFWPSEPAAGHPAARFAHGICGFENSRPFFFFLAA